MFRNRSRFNLWEAAPTGSPRPCVSTMGENIRDQRCSSGGHQEVQIETFGVTITRYELA